MGALFDYVLFPLFIPFILLWLLAARVLSLVAPVLLPLTWVLARRLSWACPFIPYIWRQAGWFRGTAARVGFEWTYCMNVCRRFLTLPLRRRTADFFIVGFPKAGTTSLAAYLKLHPAIDGIDGLRWHEALHKESHFFNGALGRGSAASSRAAYRSYFPTVLRRWWVERVRRAGKWLCFDACPVNACLDYTAARMAALNPDAKLIFMLRDPVSGAFSAEIMLRNLGMPLSWSLMEDAKPADPRFAETVEDVTYWQQVAALSPSDPLPEDLMHRFYASPYALLRSGHYANRIAPFLKHFKPEQCMFIDFTEFCSNTEAVVQRAVEFVGADPALLRFRTLPPGMAGERKGRRIHPSVKRKLALHYAPHNDRLFALLGTQFPWTTPDSATCQPRNASFYMGHAPSGTASGLEGRRADDIALPQLPAASVKQQPAAGADEVAINIGHAGEEPRQEGEQQLERQQQGRSDSSKASSSVSINALAGSASSSVPGLAVSV